MFPVWNDASTWNPLALSSSSIRYRQSVGDFHLHNNRQLYAGVVAGRLGRDASA